MRVAPVRADVSLRRRIHLHGFGVARQGPWITVEKLRCCSLSPHIGHLLPPNAPIWGHSEPDSWSRSARCRLFQQADHQREAPERVMGDSSRCGVAPSGHRLLPSGHGIVVLAAGCFGTHTSALTPPHLYAAPVDVGLRVRYSTGAERPLSDRRTEAMQYPACGIRRMILPRTPVNKGSRSPDSCAPTAPALPHLALKPSVSDLLLLRLV
jgi:hypothetical protein